MDEQKRLAALFEKFLRNACTEEEFELLLRYYDVSNKEALERLIEKEFTIDRATPMESPSDRLKLARSYEKVKSKIHIDKPILTRRFAFKPLHTVFAALAALVLLASGLGYYMHTLNVHNEQILTSQFGNDVEAGGNKATLTLSNGTSLSLTDLSNGMLAHESGVDITKTEDGQLAYTPTRDKAKTAEPAYHVIETPRGGQYRLTLPDGTRVWLNAASSLRYPVRFTGKARIVELSGEAYFEVHENKDMPFQVISNAQTVEVLGTRFNVMAYTGEEMLTTLIEGQVRVEKGDFSALLEPGQQAISGQSIQVEKVDVTEVLAWKNGQIRFSNASIQEIMRMLARWYDVEVVYQGDPVKTGFGGSVSRTKNISEILRLMELTGDVHFKIEGRRITVMP